MDTNRPLLSVITAVGRPEYDYLRAAGRSLSTLARVSGPGGYGLEWVIAVDGDSGIDVDRVADEVSCVPVTKVFATSLVEHRGPGPARNAGLWASGGVWLYTLDSDDLVNTPGVLDMLCVASRDTSLAWVGGKTFEVDAQGHPGWSGPSDPWPAGRVPVGAYWKFWQEHGRIPCMPNACLIRADAARAAGGWADLPRNEDTALLSVVSANHPGAWVPTYCHTYRKHSASLTAHARWDALPERTDAIARWVASGWIDEAVPLSA